MDLRSVTCVGAQYSRKHALPFSLLRLFVLAHNGREVTLSVPVFRFVCLGGVFVRNGEERLVPDGLRAVGVGQAASRTGACTYTTLAKHVNGKPHLLSFSFL